LTLYRGQRISRSEIDYIKNEFASYDLLVNKSFFSTTLNRNTALIYLDDQAKLTDSIQNVLFEIEVDLNTKSSYPFTDISHLSQFSIESEVLVMIGTTFKVNNNEINFKADENLWPIKLTLTSSYRDYEPNLKTTGNKRALKNCINLLPKVALNDMNDISIDQLDIIFQELFVMYQSDVPWISAIQQRTLAIYQQIHVNDYDSALIYYNESVKLWSNYVDDEELNCLRNIAKIHFDMAMCYHFYLNDLIMANKHYDSAIQFYHLALERHTTTIHEKIKIYIQLGDAYDRKLDVNNDYAIHDYGFKAIKYYKLYIRHLKEVYAMEDYWVFVNMAKLYIIHHKFDKAILTYKKAIQVYQQRNKNIPPAEGGYDIGSVYRRLITIYTNYRPNYELAISYQKMLHKHNMQSSFRTYGYNKDHDRYEMMSDDQYENDCKKDLLALHLRRLAKIDQSFNNDDLARARLLEALKLYNEIRNIWVDTGIESVNIQLLLLNPQS
jgi:tetratricopeptide (TPR) repeat protein